jgi:Zn-dependent protease
VKSHVTIARIQGIELGIHFSWAIIATLIILSLAARFNYLHPSWGPLTIWGSAVLTGLLFFVGLLIHELSHALVARARGLPVRRITLFLLGGMAQMEQEPRRPGTEFWMAIAGPLASIFLGFACLAVAWGVFGWNWWTEATTPGQAILVWLGYINLILAGFNLIPGFPMDGGRVLRAIIWRITGSSGRATLVAARIGMAVGWISWSGAYGGPSPAPALGDCGSL